MHRLNPCTSAPSNSQAYLDALHSMLIVLLCEGWSTSSKTRGQLHQVKVVLSNPEVLDGVACVAE